MEEVGGEEVRRVEVEGDEGGGEVRGEAAGVGRGEGANVREGESWTGGDREGVEVVALGKEATREGGEEVGFVVYVSDGEAEVGEVRKAGEGGDRVEVHVDAEVGEGGCYRIVEGAEDGAQHLFAEEDVEGRDLMVGERGGHEKVGPIVQWRDFQPAEPTFRQLLQDVPPARVEQAHIEDLDRRRPPHPTKSVEGVKHRPVQARWHSEPLQIRAELEDKLEEAGEVGRVIEDRVELVLRVEFDLLDHRTEVFDGEENAGETPGRFADMVVAFYVDAAHLDLKAVKKQRSSQAVEGVRNATTMCQRSGGRWKEGEVVKDEVDELVGEVRSRGAGREPAK